MNGKDAALSLVRRRLIRVQAIADVADRVDELETGVPELLRQAPALARVVDDLERDLMTVVAGLRQDDARG